jgi:hypothetical protein
LEQGLETGELAPHFSLLAAGSARRVGLRAEVGGRVVLVFHLQGTAPTAREINRAVRARPTDPEDVLVASVIDLSIVPPVYWIYVSLIPNQAYDRATDELPPGVDPSECLVIPPGLEWPRQPRLRRQDTGRAAAIVVDEGSNVALAYQGECSVEAVLGALGRLCRVGVFCSVLYDSFVFRVEADCCLLPGEEVGDQRGKASDPRQAAADPDARGPKG